MGRLLLFFFFFQAEDGIRDADVTGVQTCALPIAAYAVMSNHYHLVVKLSPDEVEPWSMDEVLARWCSLYKGPPLVQRYHRGDELCAAVLRRVERSEEHTSELQSRPHLVCRLLLE